MKSINNIFSALLLFITISAGFSCVKDYDNPASGTIGDVITVFALKQSYQGSPVSISSDVLNGASKIHGVVISDKSTNNLEAGTFVLQETVLSSNSAGDITRGIVIKMVGTATADYTIGDSLLVNITGSSLDRINGRLTLSGVTPDKITKLASNVTPIVRYVTIGMLNVGMEQYESTLISLNADATEYTAGATISGIKKLNDHTYGDLYLQTLGTATFASTALPIDAQFNGIAGYYNESGKDTAGAKKTISLRNAADIQFLSGALYAGFPESFETPDASVKASYNSGTNIVALSTGNWTLLQAILGNTILSDKFNQPGKQGIRMQQNLTTSGYVQMNFDLPDGASKVSVFYGKYATDAKSSFRLEYSVNGGTTWITVGSNITDMPEKGNKQMTWAVNITGPVRFRLNKLGIGTSNNGRLSFDDFAVYKKI